MEGLNILMGVAIYHTVHQGVFAVLEFDVLGRFHLATRKSDIKGDIVRTFVQRVPLQDLLSWAIIFPSSPLVSLRPFVGWSSNAICSW